ncbi:uncharacterized protein LOC132066579 [Lycium ferocissimum]|uniref:uncharacterized protein LOC132066579 n=1 Tax=Lycium ferocissimum TaxID=112874 RepID=UPI0028166378|nr:uncharacterized protein LOC132066579 [Lycium ferocissimum]
MKDLKPTGKTQNLYSFPWAFMAWAFEGIPHLRHQVKEYFKEVTYPRILRWLTARNNTKLSVDLFNPPKEAVSIRTQQMTSCCNSFYNLLQQHMHLLQQVMHLLDNVQQMINLLQQVTQQMNLL